LRQGLLSEPEASSGPAAITPSHGALVVSPDGVPARSDATFLWRPSTTSTSQNLKNIHDCIHSRSDVTFLWRPSTTSTSQNLKNIHACIHPRSDVTFLWRPSPSFSQNLKSIPDCIHRAMPPSSGVPRPHPYTQKKPGIFIFQRHRTPISHI